LSEELYQSAQYFFPLSSTAEQFDANVATLDADGAALYYTLGGEVYRMLPGQGNDLSLAGDFDANVATLAGE